MPSVRKALSLVIRDGFQTPDVRYSHATFLKCYYALFAKAVESPVYVDGGQTKRVCVIPLSHGQIETAVAIQIAGRQSPFQLKNELRHPPSGTALGDVGNPPAMFGDASMRRGRQSRPLLLR